MTQAHTQGDWYASGQYVTDKANFRIDENGTRWGDTPNFIIDAGTEANARLIASAPKLLEALKLLHGSIIWEKIVRETRDEGLNNAADRLEENLLVVVAAIAAAKGDA